MKDCENEEENSSYISWGRKPLENEREDFGMIFFYNFKVIKEMILKSYNILGLGNNLLTGQLGIALQNNLFQTFLSLKVATNSLMDSRRQFAPRMDPNQWH